ncbi:MAG: hypothetical protein JNK89_08075 [Saprospiraceae bacterium]|nr:hypothetical protein [Saprospiraceae bacterium]
MQPLLISRTGTTNWVIYIIGAVFGAFVSYKILAEELQRQPLNPWAFLLGAVLGLFAVFCVLAPYLFYRVFVYTDRVELVQFFGLRKQTIWRTDLVSFELLERKAKNSSWTVLKLYTRDNSYTLDSRMYANYLELLEELAHDLPEQPA